MKDMNKFLGVMFWWAIGDAFWAPVEFLSRWEFEPVDTKNWKIWELEYWKDFWDWTDDTAMALLLADSLVRCWWTNIEDQLENYLKWHNDWYMWLYDYPAWEWMQVSKMMMYYQMYKEWRIIDKPRDTDLSWNYMDGNGSLMRIGPVPLYYFNEFQDENFWVWILHDWIEDAMKAAKDSCKSTHYTDQCIDACVYYTWLIWNAIDRNEWDKDHLKEWLLDGNLSPVQRYWSHDHHFCNEILPIIKWSYKNKTADEINPSWYVIETLETALWWFYHSNSFEEWLKMVVDLWWDADTTACIYWYLAWAFYWYDAIQNYLKEWLAAKDFIKHTTEELYSHKYKEYDLSLIKPIVTNK